MLCAKMTYSIKKITVYYTHTYLLVVTDKLMQLTYSLT